MRDTTTASAPWFGPRLSKALFEAYRVLWCIGFALAVWTVTYAAFRKEQSTVESSVAYYALGIAAFTENRGQGQLVDPFEEASVKAGVRSRDVLESVDGRPTTVSRAEVLRLIAGPEGRTVALGLLHADGSRQVVRVVRSHDYLAQAYRGSGLTFPLRRWIVFTTSLVGSLMCLVAAFLLFLRQPRNRVAAVFATSLLLGRLSVQAIDPAAPAWIDQVIGGVGYLLFGFAILTFPEGHFKTNWHRSAFGVWTLAIAFVFASFWDVKLLNYTELMLLMSTSAMLAAIIIGYRHTPPGMVRQQSKFVLLGICGWILLGQISLLLGLLELRVPAHAFRPWIILIERFLDALESVWLAAGLLVALLRYRLYDAETVISRSAAYAVLTLALGAVFAGSEKVIEVLGEEFFGESSRALAAGLGAAIAATLIAPLHHRVRHWTEQRFQRALAKLRRDLPRTVQDMREFASLDHLLATTAAQLERGVRATRAVVLLGEASEPLTIALTRNAAVAEVEAWQRGWVPNHAVNLDCDRADPLFPLRLRLHADGSETIGWILLGPRPDGSFFGKDERDALAEISGPVARAIHIVRQRDAREGKLYDRMHSLESEFARLLHSIAELVTPNKAVSLD